MRLLKTINAFFWKLGPWVLVFSLWVSPVFAERHPLSDTEMAGITAGALQARPLTPEMQTGQDTLVAAHASAVLDFQEQVHLSGAVQEGANGFNLSNASLSDVANTANIWDSPRGGTGFDHPTGVNQSNRLTQTETRRGFLGSATLLGGSVDESFSRSASVSSQHSSSKAETHGLRLFSSSTVIDKSNSSVPTFNPLKNFLIRLGSRTFGNKTVYESNKVGGFTGTPKTGLEATFGPVTILGPTIDLGSLEFTGEDLVVRPGSATLPGVDFGKIKVEGCLLSGCITEERNGGVVGGQTIPSPIDQFTIDGGNPFKDINLNIGAGFVGSGKGSYKIGGIKTTLSAHFSLDIGELTGFDDVEKGSGGFRGFAEKTLSVPMRYDIPPIEIDVVKIVETPGFEMHFDGVVCVSVAPLDCGQNSHTVKKEEVRDESHSEFSHETTSFTESNQNSFSQSVSTGATLSDAESEYLVFVDSSLDVSVSSGIDLANEAQQNFSGINSVNATVAVVGNALNLSSLRSTPSAIRHGSGLRLTQGNFFVQRR